MRPAFFESNVKYAIFSLGGPIVNYLLGFIAGLAAARVSERKDKLKGALEGFAVVNLIMPTIDSLANASGLVKGDFYHLAYADVPYYISVPVTLAISGVCGTGF